MSGESWCLTQLTSNAACSGNSLGLGEGEFSRALRALMPVLSQYALSSTSASRSASFPSVVGNVFRRPILSRSVEKERAVLRTSQRSSSRNTFTHIRVSVLILVGRTSDKIVSAFV